MTLEKELIWPVPESYNRRIQKKGESGDFLEERTVADKKIIHRGTDIYASRESSVVAPEDLEIIKVAKWTSPQETEYWNDTVYALALTRSGEVLNFAELEGSLEEGKLLDQGTTLGTIGQVLNPRRIDGNSPPHIQDLKKKGRFSMLHLERLDPGYPQSNHFKEGILGTKLPLEFYRDPAEYLIRCK